MVAQETTRLLIHEDGADVVPKKSQTRRLVYGALSAAAAVVVLLGVVGLASTPASTRASDSALTVDAAVLSGMLEFPEDRPDSKEWVLKLTGSGKISLREVAFFGQNDKRQWPADLGLVSTVDAEGNALPALADGKMGRDWETELPATVTFTFKTRKSFSKLDFKFAEKATAPSDWSWTAGSTVVQKVSNFVPADSGPALTAFPFGTSIPATVIDCAVDPCDLKDVAAEPVVDFPYSCPHFAFKDYSGNIDCNGQVDCDQNVPCIIDTCPGQTVTYHFAECSGSSVLRMRQYTQADPYGVVGQQIDGCPDDWVITMPEVNDPEADRTYRLLQTCYPGRGDCEGTIVYKIEGPSC